MRTRRFSIRAVTLDCNLAGPSSGARTLAQRSHSTHSHAAAQPLLPVMLQDLANRALKPAFFKSTLLQPAPQASTKVVFDKEEWAQLPESSKPKPSPPAHVNPDLARTDESESENELYDNRAQLIIRLIRLNRILSAMSTFVSDVQDTRRVPFTAKQLEDFIVSIRIQTKRHATTQPAPKKVNTDIAPDLWRPAQLDPSIPAKALSIPAQCMYAIAMIYDVCIEHKFQPTARMVSATLASFIGLLGTKQLHQAANYALGHLIPSEDKEGEEGNLRKINHRALATFIHAYGRVGKPKKGEALLARWAAAQRVEGFPKDKGWLDAGEDGEVVDLAGWGNNVVIWQLLVKARMDGKDMVGARVWLDRYRMAAKGEVVEGATMPPPIKADPYLTYMAGIRDKLSTRDPSTRAIGKAARQQMMSDFHGVVRLMVADHVPIESSVLAFVIGFEASVGNVNEGTLLVEELSSLITTDALSDANLITALLDMRRAAAQRTSSLQTSVISSTRALIRKLVQIGEGELSTSRKNLATCRSRGTLNTALATALADRDYPASIVVLNLFEHWRITPSHTTYCIVLDALVAQGHYLAISADAGETASVSMLNLEATLQSMAREGNGKQAEKIRRTLANMPEGSSETLVVSAQLSTMLRQTQYLVRVLNRICAAEIRGKVEDERREGPEWLGKVAIGEVEGEGEGRVMSDEKVAKKLKFYVYKAQDELLGKSKEERAKNTGVKSTVKAPLLGSAPTISPRRRGFEASSSVQSKFGDQNFSTSAIRRDEGVNGESCDLASAAKGDFTHVDPVRTVYIPGFVPYHIGLALQEHLVKQRADARSALRSLSESSSNSASTLAGLSTISPSASEASLRAQAAQDTLLLLQHRPVYTEGRRHDSENELVSSHLRSLGADYYLTKRGGQITYHGPGQLVGYPILNLASMNLASRCYVDKIQDSLISLLADRGVETVEPPENHTGVWADEYHKIASIGIQVRHRISNHGFAVNVEKRAMAGFRHIIACGIVGRNMTCLQDRLDPEGPFAKYNKQPRDGKGDREEGVESVARDYREHFTKVFGRRMRDMAEEEFKFELGKEGKAGLLKEKLNVKVEEEEGLVEGVEVDGRPVAID